MENVLEQDAGGVVTDLDGIDNSFVRDTTSKACSDEWENWASEHGRAPESDNVLVFQLYPAIGNLFISITHLLAVAHFLGTSVSLDWKESFPGFRHAFEPARISWDTDTTPLRQHVLEIEQGRAFSDDLHVKTFPDGMVALSDAQFKLLTTTLDVDAGNMTDLLYAMRDPPITRMRNFLSTTSSKLSRDGHIDMSVESCAWNMLLRLSPTMMAAMKTYSPWSTGDSDSSKLNSRSEDYVAWHLRIPTEADLRTGYDPKVHRYMIRETPDVVCSSFYDGMQGARERCPAVFTNDTQVYISSISSPMGNSCIDVLNTHDMQGVQVDMGLTADEAHTSHNKTGNTDSAINAFLDFMFMMNAKAIFRTGSSFSGTVVAIRELVCFRTASPDNVLLERGLVSCVPKSLGC